MSKHYAVRVMCPYGDDPQWVTLSNREESLEQVLETPWDFECPVHGVQRGIPLEANEKPEHPAPSPQVKPAPEWTQWNVAKHPPLRRAREIRIRKTIRVWVRGSDRNGNPFTQSAYSVDISRSGARLDGIGTLAIPGANIELRRLWRKARFRVVWAGQVGTPQISQVGVYCLEPNKNFWGVAKATCGRRL